MIRLALTVTSAVLLGVLGWQWRNWPPPPVAAVNPPLNASTAPAPPPETVTLPPPPERERYANVLERPLFRPDRKPEPPPDALSDPTTAPVTTAELEALDLTAVVLTPTLVSAWVRDPSQPKPLRLRLGDELKGWTVQNILEDGVALTREAEEYTLILRDYSKLPPPPVAAPAETPPAQQQVPLRPPRVPAGAPPSRADRRAAPAPPER
jgi:general secretion pathway protein N